MAVLTAATLGTSAQPISRPRAGRSSYVVQPSDTVYAGGFVCINAGGYLAPLDDVAGSKFVGIALETVTGDGTLECRVNESGDILTGAAVATIARADVNALVYCATDNPGDMRLSATSNTGPIGIVKRYTSSGIGDVGLFTPTEHEAKA